MWKQAIIISVSLISLTLLLIPPAPSQAQKSYLVRLVKQYPHLADTKLDDCVVCHAQGVGGGYTNAFAEDYFDKGFSFSNIEGIDSDGDGFTNLEEIMEGTFPGNPKNAPRSVNKAPVEPEPEPTPVSLNGVLAEKTSQERAAFLYTVYCVNCHGAYTPDGKFTNLRDLPPARKPEIRAVIQNGLANTTMPAWAEQAGGPLSDQHIDDLTALLINWYTPPTPVPTPTIAPATPPPPPFVAPSTTLLSLTGIFVALATVSFVIALRLTSSR